MFTMVYSLVFAPEQRMKLLLLFLQVIEKQHRMMEQLGSQIQVFTSSK